MLAAALFHGILIVGALIVYGRWLDEEISGDICLYGLLCELVFAAAASNYFSVTDSQVFLDLGSLLSGELVPALPLVFCFDALSGYFLGILTVALVFCFYFLVEYFEYDAGASMIITLSALFSQVALLYFSAFDLFSLMLC